MKLTKHLVSAGLSIFLVGGATMPALAGVSDIVRAKDSVEFHEPTGKIAFDLSGYRDLPAGNVPANTTLGSWSVQANGKDPQRLAISFGTNHNPVQGAGENEVTAFLTYEPGKGIAALLAPNEGSTVETVSEQGVKWLVTTDAVKDFKGSIRSYKDQDVPANTIPFYMNAAIFNA